METRSKTLKGATGSDVRDLEAVGEADIRPACDPSPPVLSPVEIRAPPVQHDDEVITGQHQEPSSASPRPAISTQHWTEYKIT